MPAHSIDGSFTIEDDRVAADPEWQIDPRREHDLCDPLRIPARNEKPQLPGIIDVFPIAAPGGE